MKTKDRHISRGVLTNKLLPDFIIISRIPPFLGITLLSLLPAFFYGCGNAAADIRTPVAASSTMVSMQNSTAEISTLDVFVFIDDRLQGLDCYQRFDDMDDWQETVMSGSGERIVSILANCPYGKERWYPMRSRHFLREVSVNLEDEFRNLPVMFGETAADMGNGSSIEEMFLCPLASEVRLNSLCCDFTGRAYAGEKLSDVRVYLTNVNAECMISEDVDISPPIRIINAGKADEEDIGRFRDPGIIIQEIHDEIGTETVYPDVSLRCYRNDHPEETPGSPYTRLVIEGKVTGKTYYWPININRDTEEDCGVQRGKCYSYDVTITRKGSSDPDIPVKAADITINQEIKPWTGKEGYEVTF